jgi:uncharacterized protein
MQSSIGMLYQLGLGTSKNFKKAFYWHTKSAEQGLPQAQFSLGYR